MIFSIFYFHYATKYTNILFVLLFALCSGIVSLCSDIRSTAAGRQFILTTGPISEHHFGSYGFPPPLPFPSVGTSPPPSLLSTIYTPSPTLPFPFLVMPATHVFTSQEKLESIVLLSPPPLSSLLSSFSSLFYPPPTCPS